MRLVSPYELEYELRSIEAHSMIVPYPTRLIDDLSAKIRIITTPENAYKLNGNCEKRTLESLHAKIAIGKKGALFGSWNFSKSNYKFQESPSRRIEGVIKIDFCEPLFKELEAYFNGWWSMARPVKKLPTEK